jgi:hypothetical protein
MILCLTLALLSVGPGFAAKTKEEAQNLREIQFNAGVMTPMKYEGGSLPLNQHDKLQTFVN